MRFALLLLAVSALQGQVNAVRPLSGFIFNSSSGTLHRIHGVPGSALIGPAVATNLQHAWPAPEGGNALALRGGATLLLSRLDHLDGVRETSAGLLTAPETAAWSSRGLSAVLIGGGQLQILRFGSEPSVDAPVEVSSVGAVVAVAVNDSGQAVVATAEGLYITKPSGLTPLNGTAGIKAMRFLGDDVYVATHNGLLRVSGSDGAVQMLMESAAIVDFGVSRVDGRLYVADSEARSVHIYARSGQKVATIALDVVPATVQPVAGGSVFLLNPPEKHGSSAIVLQVSEHPAAFFVPADPSSL